MSDKTASTLRTALLAAAVASLAMLSPPAIGHGFAYDEASTAAINVDDRGIAMQGYDPVAYFTLGTPTPGDAAITASFGGAAYQFASAANRDLFLAEPERYIPAFGGFCAMGTVFGKKLDGNPQYWRIVDGRLYLNVGEPAQTRWLQDVPGNIATATDTWPTIKDRAPRDL
jgi:YHS domain-containing protein